MARRCGAWFRPLCAPAPVAWRAGNWLCSSCLPLITVSVMAESAAAQTGSEGAQGKCVRKQASAAAPSVQTLDSYNYSSPATPRRPRRCSWSQLAGNRKRRTSAGCCATHSTKKSEPADPHARRHRASSASGLVVAQRAQGGSCGQQANYHHCSKYNWRHRQS
jgi:hypothetical protein